MAGYLLPHPVTLFAALALLILVWVFALATYINENYVNHASASITNDLLVVVAVFLIWSFVEARRLQMSHWWLS